MTTRSVAQVEHGGHALRIQVRILADHLPSVVFLRQMMPTGIRAGGFGQAASLGRRRAERAEQSLPRALLFLPLDLGNRGSPKSARLFAALGRAIGDTLQLCPGSILGSRDVKGVTEC